MVGEYDLSFGLLVCGLFMGCPEQAEERVWKEGIEKTVHMSPLELGSH